MRQPRSSLFLAIPCALGLGSCCGFEYDPTPHILADGLMYEISRSEEGVLGWGFCQSTYNDMQNHVWVLKMGVDRPPNKPFTISVDPGEQYTFGEYVRHVEKHADGDYCVIFSSCFETTERLTQPVLDAFQTDVGSIGVRQPNQGSARARMSASDDDLVATIVRPDALLNLLNNGSEEVQEAIRSALSNALDLGGAELFGATPLQLDEGTSEGDECEVYFELWVIHTADFGGGSTNYDPGKMKLWSKSVLGNAPGGGIEEPLEGYLVAVTLNFEKNRTYGRR